MSRTVWRRAFALLLAVGVLLLPVALPAANAEPDYPPVFNRISAAKFTTHVGGTIVFKAQTFQAGSTVTFTVTDPDGNVVSTVTKTANRKGIAKTPITFTVEGTNTLTVTGTASTGDPLTMQANVTVKPKGQKLALQAGVAAGSAGTNGTGATGSGSDSASDPQAESSSGVPFFGGGLPRQGGDIAITVLIGLALLGGGTALVVATRRRRTQ